MDLHENLEDNAEASQLDQISIQHPTTQANSKDQATKFLEKRREASSQFKNCCEICYSVPNEVFRQSEFSQFFRLIHCKTCKMTVHTICNGIETATEDSLNENNEMQTVFECDRCQANLAGISCHICKVSEGCLKQTTDGKWIHPVCGIISQSIKYDINTMKIDVSAFRKDTKKAQDRKCEVCKNKVGTLKCMNNLLETYCHIHCALRDSIVSKSWRVFFQTKSSPVFCLQIEDNLLMANIEEMALDLKESIGKAKDFGKDSIIKTLKGKKGVRGKFGRKRVDREESSVNEFFQEIFEETKINSAEISGDDVRLREPEEDELEHIGGEITLLYVDNVESQMEIESEGVHDSAMIQEFLETEFKELTEQEFHSDRSLKKRMNIPEMDRVTFPEILALAILFNNRALSSFKDLATFQELKALIQEARKIPFPLNGLAPMLIERIQSSIAADILLKSHITACEPRSLYSETRGEFDEAALKRNSNLISIANQLQKIYHKEYTKILTPGLLTISKFGDQLNFLEGLYYQLSSHKEKTSSSPAPTKTLFSILQQLPLSTLEELHSKALEVGLDNHFLEIKMLEEGASGKLKEFTTEIPLQRNELATFSVPKSNKQSVFKIQRDQPYQAAQNRGGFSSEKQSLEKLSATIKAKSKSCVKNEFKLSLSKKGRPPKMENLINEIEQNYEQQLNILKEKIDLKNVEENLASFNGTNFEGENEETLALIKFLEEAMQQSLDWKASYENLTRKKGGSLEVLMNKMATLEIKIPEMEDALLLQKHFLIWRVKVSNLRRRCKNKRSDAFGLDAEVSIEELERVVSEGEFFGSLEEEEDFDFKELKKMLTKIKEVQEDLQSHDENLFQVDFGNIERELELANSQFDEDLASGKKSKKQDDDEHILLEIEERLKQATSKDQMMINQESSKLWLETPEKQNKPSQKKFASSAKVSVNSYTTKTPEAMQSLMSNAKEGSFEKNDDTIFMESHEQDDKIIEEEKVEEEPALSWKQEVRVLLGDNLTETLQSVLETLYSKNYDYNEMRGELEGYKRRCSRLCTAYSQEIEEEDRERENQQLQMMVQWLNWIIQALNMKQQVEEDKDPLSFGELKLAVEKMKEIQLGQGISLCGLIQGWYEKAEKVRREYRRGYDQVRGRLQMTNLGSGKKMQEQIKLSVSEARRTLELLKSVADFVRFSQEIEIVSEDLQDFEAWNTKTQEFCERYEDTLDPKTDCEEFLIANKEDIEREFELLKREMGFLVIESRANELELKVFEWIFQTLLVVKKVQKDVHIDDIKKLMEDGERLQFEGSSNPHIITLVAQLKREIGSTEKTKIFVENIRKIKESNKENQKISYEALLGAMGEIKGKKGSLREESRQLEELYLKCEEFKESARNFLNESEGKKYMINDFIQFNDQLKGFLIDLKEERQAIEEAITKANKIMSEIKKNVVPDFDQMASIVGRYRGCSVFIKKADEIEKTYTEIKRSYDKVLLENRKVLNGESKLTFEELRDLSFQVDRIQEYKPDESLKIAKKNFFGQEVEILRASLKQKDETQVTLPFRSFKEMVFEVSNLKNEFRKENQVSYWEEIRDFLEGQLKIAEGVFHQIQAFKDLSQLEAFPSVRGFVNFAEEIAEKRASMNAITSIPSLNLRYIDFEADKEEAERRERELKEKKRGRPKKTVEKFAEKEKEKDNLLIKDLKPSARNDQTTRRFSPIKDKERERDLEREKREREKEKEKEKEKLRSGVSRQNLSQDTLRFPPKSSSQESTTSGKPKSKEANFFEKENSSFNKPKESLKLDPVQLTLRKIIESSKLTGLSTTQLHSFVQVLVWLYPELSKSSMSLSRISDTLRTVLKRKHIGQSIVEKSFDSTYVRTLMSKSEQDLNELERSLRIKKQQEEKSETGSDITQEKPIKKKPKGSRSQYTPSTEGHVFSLLSNDQPRRTPKENTSSFSGLFQKKEKKKDIDVASIVSLESETFSLDEGSVAEFIPQKMLKPVKNYERSFPRMQEVIPYDPDNPNDWKTQMSQEVIPYDPDLPKEQTKILSQKPNVETIEIPEINDVKDIPKGSVLKIYEGTLVYGDEIECTKVGLFTCNPFEVVNNIPEIQQGANSLEISGKISFERFQAYVNKALNSLEIKEEKLISGWVESHLSAIQNYCDQISMNLVNEGKVGVIQSDESSKIFFLHKNQFPEDWISPLGFNFQKIQPYSNPSLYFIIYHKPAKLTTRVRSIAPEMVTILSNSQKKPDFSRNKKNFGENSPALSLSSIDSIDACGPQTNSQVQSRSRMLASQNSQEKKEDEYSAFPYLNKLGNKNQGGFKGAPFPVQEGLNRKRPYDEMRETSSPFSNSKNPDPRLESTPNKYSEDPRKKLKTEEDSERQRFQDLKEELLKYPEDKLLEKLEKMGNDQVILFARDLDKATRERIMRKLQALNTKENGSLEKALPEKNNQIEEEQIQPQENSQTRPYFNKVDSFNQRSSYYHQSGPGNQFRSNEYFNRQTNYNRRRFIPPDYMLRIFNLFTPEELELARQKSQSSSFKKVEPSFQHSSQSPPQNNQQSQSQSHSQIPYSPMRARSSFPTSNPSQKVFQSVAGSQSSQNSSLSKDIIRTGSWMNDPKGNQKLSNSKLSLESEKSSQRKIEIEINQDKMEVETPKSSQIELEIPVSPHFGYSESSKPIEPMNGFESPLFGKVWSEKRADGRQATPEWPKGKPQGNEGSLHKNNYSFAASQNPFLEPRREEPKKETKELLETSFGGSNQQRDEDFVPEGKSTVETQNQKLSVESREDSTSFLLQNLPSSFLSNIIDSKNQQAQRSSSQQQKNSQSKEPEIRNFNTFQQNVESSRYQSNQSSQEIPRQESQSFSTQQSRNKPSTSSIEEEKPLPNRPSQENLQSQSPSMGNLSSLGLPAGFNLASIPGLQITNGMMTLPKSMLDSLNSMSMATLNKPLQTANHSNTQSSGISQTQAFQQVTKPVNVVPQKETSLKANLLQQLQQQLAQVAANKQVPASGENKPQNGPAKKPALNLGDLQKLTNLFNLAKVNPNTNKK